MKKNINISIFLLILFLGCSESKKNNQTINAAEKKEFSSENIHQELSLLLLESIDTTIFKDYTIEFENNLKIDSLEKKHLSLWTLENEIFSDDERFLLKKLIVLKETNERFNENELITEKLLVSNQETDNLFIQNLSNIVTDSNNKIALTILGTYFTTKKPESHLSGWKEIIVFEKVKNDWAERKRFRYLEY